MVAYLLDKKLSETGNHIGEVLRVLYQRFGTEATHINEMDGISDSEYGYITNDQILSAFNEVSGPRLWPTYCGSSCVAYYI